MSAGSPRRSRPPVVRRVEAALVLARRRGRALVLRRQPDDRSFPHAWSLPGGRLEPGERPDQAVLRETLEESGLAVRLTHDLGRRVLPIGARPVELHIHRFVGDAADGAVVLSDEHVDHRWLDRAEAGRAEGLLEGGLAGEVTTELLRLFGAREL